MFHAQSSYTSPCTSHSHSFFVDAVITPSMSYGAGTWTLTLEHENMIRSTQCKDAPTQPVKNETVQRKGFGKFMQIVGVEPGRFMQTDAMGSAKAIQTSATDSVKFVQINVMDSFKV